MPETCSGKVAWGGGGGGRERLYWETMSISGDPGRGPVTDVASPYVAPASNGGSADNTEEPDRHRQETLHLEVWGTLKDDGGV